MIKEANYVCQRNFHYDVVAKYLVMYLIRNIIEVIRLGGNNNDI